MNHSGGQDCRRMELRHLRYFRAVASTLNFSRAAEQLHVAQPALSRQIRNLEEELGARLFDRDRVHVQLTDAGRTLVAHADKILADVDIAVNSVQDTRRGTGGQLMICNDWRLSIQLIPATIAEFHARYPGIEVALIELHLHEQIAALRGGRAHVCFVPFAAIPTRGDFASMPILKAGLRVAVGRSHPLAHRQSVRLAEFRNDTFIRINGRLTQEYNTYVVQACRLAGFSPIFVTRKASTPETLLTIAGAGAGVALLPDFLCKPERPFLRFLPTDCQPVEIYAVWLHSETSRLLKDYLEILRTHARALGVLA
jgi:DNA-binding transcriptional LysR family regulator